MSATGDRPARAGQSGETLIEALVVVSILALVSAIVFPRLQQGLLTLAQRQTAAAVTARLRVARAEALALDAPVVFVIGPDGRSYGLGGGAATPAPPGLSLEARGDGEGRIAFFGDGSSSGGVVWILGPRRAMQVKVGGSGGAVAMAQG